MRGRIHVPALLLAFVLATGTGVSANGPDGDDETFPSEGAPIVVIPPGEPLHWDQASSYDTAIVAFRSEDGSCATGGKTEFGRMNAETGTQVREMRIDRLGPCVYSVQAREYAGDALVEYWRAGGGFPAGDPYCVNPILCDEASDGGEPEEGPSLSGDPCASASKKADGWIYTNTPSNPLTRSYVGIDFCYDGSEAALKTTPPTSHCLAVSPWSDIVCDSPDYFAGPTTVYVWGDKYGEFIRLNPNKWHALYAVAAGFPDGDNACSHGWDGDWDGTLFTACSP